MISQSFWQGKRVYITGHTGFKGSWLSLWLQYMGAIVNGFALPEPTKPSLFQVADVAKDMGSEYGDIRDYQQLLNSINTFKPDIVFHMAAQPLVRLSYSQPVETYATNVMGTVHLLEAVRHVSSVKAVVCVTSDKCYENREWVWGYRENEAMGGYDPYSSSKGCSELVASAYRNSFFSSNNSNEHSVSIATARAGNVIGGGDWALDRIIPDILKAFEQSQSVCIRNPQAIRPWQHVLEPLSGYLVLAQCLYLDGHKYASAWNFGPDEKDAIPVLDIVNKMVSLWGDGASWHLDDNANPHEAHHLKLDCSKAKVNLKWKPCWELDTTLSRIIKWHKAWLSGADMRQCCIQEIKDYMNAN